MRLISVALIAILTTACVSTKPYQFYEGQTKSAAEVSTIKPQRSFGGPAVFVKYVNGKYISDYKSMAGYPENLQQANILQPLVLQVTPGKHTINVGFAFTDSPNKFATVAALTGTALLTGVGVASADLVTYRQSADIAFTTKANKTYQINYLWDEVKGVTFYVNECNAQEKGCSKIGATVDATDYSIVPGMLDGQALLAR